MNTPITADQHCEAIAALSARIDQVADFQDRVADHVDRVTEILMLKSILASAVSTQDLEKAGGFVAHYSCKMLMAWLAPQPDLKNLLLASLGVLPSHGRDVCHIHPCFHGNGCVPRGGEAVVQKSNEAGIGSHERHPAQPPAASQEA